jgi:hypothetical protein
VKRTGFKRPAYERAPRAPVQPVVGCRGVYAPSSDAVLAQPKDEPLQHAGYIATVRTFRCIHCGWPPPSDFAHADMNKGAGIKSDCRLGYPACRPHLLPDGGMDPGCHWRIGTKRIYPKARRHELEIEFGRRTRATVQALGLWPKSLPPLPVPEEQ